MGASDTCTVCACLECYDEYTACRDDAGCQTIRDCIQEFGCRGIDCLGPCGDVIQRNGGPFGPAGTKAQALSTCLDRRCQDHC
ncbi:hypothetical protein SAMN02745121_08920 [Nannocystis exedens]|uniref:Uncharacterized protein n=1 Tax=Nannocystis exedens TaxID=54 RepID=A0A1I2IR49_9BACT|nr:hypothetical protein NAEX_01222 [Nannocystis exedens]SFF44795.1 hypothetical protein SAMN02745121_08920 [Nannocystis exedens]